MKYSPGKYIFKESRVGSFFRRFTEYLQGVTLARQSINRIKPNFINRVRGDIIEIGGYENYFKSNYREGKYLNLDITPEEGVVDIVGNAEQLSSLVREESLGGILCISVIEHTRQPEKIINEIFTCLKPGGLALISSPWLFESHMEPSDYFRFSRYQSEIYFERFEILKVDYTNSYFGLIAHIMQFNLPLRWIGGLIFFMLDTICENNSRWSTQITYILAKKA